MQTHVPHDAGSSITEIRLRMSTKIHVTEEKDTNGVSKQQLEKRKH